MENAANDNYGLLTRTGWQAQSRNDEKKDGEAERDRRRQESEKEKAERHREYVDHRLEELERWERGLGIRRQERRAPEGAPSWPCRTGR